MRRFRTQVGLFLSQPPGDETHEHLGERLLFLPRSGLKWSFEQQDMELRMFPMKAEGVFQQPRHRLLERKGTGGVERSCGVGHLPGESRCEAVRECFLVRKELVERRRGDTCLRSDRVGCGLMVAVARENAACGFQQLLLPLLAAGVALSEGIVDCHTAIFADHEI